MNPSIQDIQEVLRLFLDSELQDLRLEIGNVRLAVSRRADGAIVQPFAAAPASPAPTSAAQAAAVETAPLKAPEQGTVVVTAPSVGTFYRCPAPHQPPFVEIGSEVEAGATVCLIEVMKMFAGVTAPCKGRIAQILVEDATLVEHGQPLMTIVPAAA
jgi:acetyl-CoA carboxylase biotin carboxyl carrier protein